MNGSKIDIKLLVLSGIGILMAVFAGLSEQVAWLSSFCLGLPDVCRQTAGFTLFGVPLWLWGVGFYILLAISSYRIKELVPWLVAGAFGVELRLMWIMFSSQAICVFCLGNFVVVALLLILCFPRIRVWQTISATALLFLLSIFFIPRLNESVVAAPEENQDPVVAVVAGEPITESELEAPLSSRIYRLQREIFQLKRERLDQMIAEILLQKEAEKEGISLEELIDNSILSGGVPISEEELDRYFQDHRADLRDWTGSKEELRKRMEATVRQRKAYQMIMDYARALRQEYEVVVNLEQPANPLVQLDVRTDPAIGPENAPVTIIEFSDYQCPACQRNHAATRKIREEYKGRIRWIFKDFPLEKHKLAEKAAEAAHCAGEQGEYWEYQDILFALKGNLAPDVLRRQARELGLDMDSFDRCLESGKFRPGIADDIIAGKSVGVNSTPSFIINGRLVTGGLSLERFREIIDRELQKAKRRPIS